MINRSTDIEHQAQPAAALLPATVTPAQMLALAIERGADLDRLERLMDLQERWEANEARKAYVVAMAAFKSNPPRIVKDRLVEYSGTSYSHASLGAVVDAVADGLSRVGITHRWSLEQDGQLVRVTCTLTHVQGHSEITKMESGADNSGKKNVIQSIASAVTYLQRYTLLAATGLATYSDDDARAAEPEFITAEQAAELEALLVEVGADRAKFFAWAKVDCFESLRTEQFARAVKLLEAKR